MRIFFTLILINLVAICAHAQTVPAVSIVTKDTMFCTGKAITYSAVSSDSTLSYLWAVIPSKGLTSYTDLNSSSISLTFSGTVNYTVFLNVSDISGNSNTVFTIVSPKRSAIASFNASLSSEGFPANLTLTNYSQYSLKNYWKFSDAVGIDSSLSLVKEYNANGNYSVLLYSYGEEGCDDSESYDFTISETSSLILPTIFTPNRDGINDVFIPITKGILGLKAWVYNRFGVIVATWDKPKQGWDGYTTAGEECSEGVYFICVDAYGFDGVKYNLKGTITLAR
ncbi:gliding motility-associated C-terminal domain-containing protein [Aurantibacillus circumpalustris]|uniref:T9SS type B sorting domain-containing protein n=1 Tax=Aurantibacillus circumpalustris TaxID=3036359 RepID=UPI00295A7B82|nr:gliding motility-associated C-terminal domain-containing protein [Aurantibacillus circumpalustris]